MNATNAQTRTFPAEWERWFETEVSRCATDAHERMLRGERVLYLYFVIGRLVAVQDNPGGDYQLAQAERLPRFETSAQLREYIRVRAFRLPLLPPESPSPCAL